MRLASDEREHRRGLVLGLTMAEVLLLLLFLLLLALAARLLSQAKAINTLKPLIETVKSGDQVTPEIVTSVVRDLASAVQLRKDNEALKTALSDARKRDEALRRLEARAREIDPDEPLVALRRGLDALALQKDAREWQARSELLSRLEKAAKAVNPGGAPQATIEAALATMIASKQASADAKMGVAVRDVFAVVRDTEHTINRRLNEAFGDKFRAWGAVLEPDSLTLRFQNEGVLFEKGKDRPKPEFERILRDMFPQYIDILYGFKDSLEEIRIEGHTSSEWADPPDPINDYFQNMQLSQQRTRAVLEYGLTKTALANDPQKQEWARKIITANGLSSSRPREADGKEDRDSSRRVEFRVLTRAKEELLKIIDPGSR